MGGGGICIPVRIHVPTHVVENEELPSLALVVSQGGVGGCEHCHIVVKVELVHSFCTLQHPSKLEQAR